MLLQSKGFNINGFQIPPFTLHQGKMVRLWVQNMPISSEKYNWGMASMEKTIKSLKQDGIKIVIGASKVKRGWLDFFKPISTKAYLEKRFDLSQDEIDKLLAQFEIKPFYKVKDLGLAHQKVFAIMCAFQESGIVAFDYYGLSLMTEQQLTEFVKTQLKKGKSAIGFDTLQYKPKTRDTEEIINLDVLI